jgi:hypothetical protein
VPHFAFLRHSGLQITLTEARTAPIGYRYFSITLLFRYLQICICDLGLLNALSVLREDHRLRVFENRVLTRIFGPKRDEVTGEWRKLHNEELHNLY